MGREIHKAKIQGKTRYALLSTVVMDYVTPFMPRKTLEQHMKMEGYKPDVVKSMFKEATTVKKVKGQEKVSFPVIRLEPKKSSLTVFGKPWTTPKEFAGLSGEPLKPKRLKEMLK